MEAIMVANVANSLLTHRDTCVKNLVLVGIPSWSLWRQSWCLWRDQFRVQVDNMQKPDFILLQKRRSES